MDCLDTGPRSCLPRPSPIPGWGCRLQLPARTHTTSPAAGGGAPTGSQTPPQMFLQGSFQGGRPSACAWSSSACSLSCSVPRAGLLPPERTQEEAEFTFFPH